MSVDNRRLLRLRRDDVCADCGAACPRGTEGWWYPDERIVRCRSCVEGEELIKELTGTAGRSARAEGDHRHERRREHLRSRFGRAASVVEFLTEEPQSTRSWIEGGASEARVGTYLDRELAGVAVVLHDRRVPRPRANIDHVIVASSGVWVVDSKARSGRVERRDQGPLWRSDVRLYVGGRDHTKHLAAMHDQREVVLAALGEPHPPVHAALCFNGADWGMFGRSFTLAGVLVTWPGDLVEKARRGDLLGSEEITRLAARLAAGLPPAS